MRLIFSGRNAVRLNAQADGLGLEYFHVSVDDQESIVVTKKDVPLNIRKSKLIGNIIVDL